MSNKEAVLDHLDQAYLSIMDAKDMLDDQRHFHLAGELLACGSIVNKIFRETMLGNEE
jgi:hypothetical protein